MDGPFALAPPLPRRREPAAARGLVLFDEEFEAAPSTDQSEGVAPIVDATIFTAADLAAACESSRREGRDLGFAEAAAAQEAALDAAATSVAAQIAALRDEQRRHTDSAAAAVAGLLLETLAALFPALCARHGAAEAAAVLRAVLPGLAGAPALTLRANPTLLDRLGAELARLDPDLAARTTLVASELAAPGDVALAWQHGQATREARALWNAVEAALAPAGFLGPAPEENEHGR